MSTAVAFIWHMHQPYYKDMLTGKYSMPWVRLHAIKAYYDMAAILEEYPKMRYNVNIVPSLILQIKDYAEGKFKDVFWDLSVKPAKDLTLDDKKFLLWNFFMANWETMIKPNPRFWELLMKRGTKVTEEDIEILSEKFTERDYRDLQVLFNLSWFGFMARKNFPQVAEMINKGKNFSEEDKKIVLNTQIDLIRKLLPLYKKLQENGQIEITTTPCFHPIMPLVYCTDFAKRCMPWVALPNKFSQPEDVQAHIEMAVQIYKDAFGVKPRGMWPSEGSVCPEIMPIISRNGFRWLATDEEILMNTIEISDRGKGLYKPYVFQHGSENVTIVFRDKNISNAISFDYQKMDSSYAAGDLVRNLQNINDYTSRFGHESLVSVVLDGENPWEGYHESGEPFLRALCKRLSESQAVYPTTVSDYLDKHPPKDELQNLYTGSWINHNFDIWIGDPEENAGWNYVGRTREFLEKESRKGIISKEKLKLAWMNLYAAEGSDWFWWYGDDFSTDCDEEFDLIFRTHLSNVYTVTGHDVPDYLKESILYVKEVQPAQPPIAFIEPVIDGVNTYFYEWTDSGYHDVERYGGTLYRGESYLSRVYFGFNKKTLFLRFDPLTGSTAINGRDLRVYFNIIQPKEYQITFPLSFDPEKIKQFTLNSSEDGVTFDKVGDYDSIKAKQTIELSIPFKDLKIKPNEVMHFYVQVKTCKTQLDRYPRRGYLTLMVPGEEFELSSWSA